MVKGVPISIPSILVRGLSASSRDLIVGIRSFFCYNELMEKIHSLVPVVSHLLFTILSYSLLEGLFDWSKWVKGDYRRQQAGLKVFLLLLSIGLGYLTSSFLLALLNLGRELAGLI